VKTAAPDKEILFQKLSEGDTEAYTALYILLNEETYFLCKKFARHEEDAQDLFQDAFSYLWEKKHLFASVENPAGYFYTMIRNLCYQRLKDADKRNKISDSFPEKEPELQEEPYINILGKEKDRLVKAEINRLSPQQRKALSMQRYDGMSYQEIADALNISCQTVKQHLKNAMHTLRQKLGQIDIQQ